MPLPTLLVAIHASLFLLPIWTNVVAANCYLINGTDINTEWGNGDRYASCNTKSSGASMCCSINGGGDGCVPIYADNPSLALCNNQDDNVLWRESCTDQNWQSVNCVKLFMNVTDTDIRITNCSAFNLGEGFCYGQGNLGCCAAGQAVFIDPVSGEQVSTNPALSTSTKTSTSSPAPTSTSTSKHGTSTPASSNGLSSGAKAGIGVGVSLLVVVLLGIAGMIILFRRKRTNQYKPKTTQPELYQPVQTDSKDKLNYSTLYEMESNGRDYNPGNRTSLNRTEAAELEARQR